MKKRKHKIGASWKAMRKVGRKRRRVVITKVGKSRYKVRVAGKRAARRRHKRLHTSRGWTMDRAKKSKEPWERAYRRRKRR